jgi:hypothetical protein
MDEKLVQVYANELAFLTARLNRRVGEMEGMNPNSPDFRDAVRVADFLAQEITAPIQKLRLPGTHRRPTEIIMPVRTPYKLSSEFVRVCAERNTVPTEFAGYDAPAPSHSGCQHLLNLKKLKLLSLDACPGGRR